MRKAFGWIAVLALAALAFATPAAASASAAAMDKNTPRELSAVVAEQARSNVAATCYRNVYIMSHDSRRFVSTEMGYQDFKHAMLRARATSVGPWERFTVCYQDWYWTIQSQANDRFVSVELNHPDEYQSLLRARATAVGPWERFTINTDACGINCTVIRSQANDRIVAAELNSGGDDWGMLRARSTAVGPWERFQIVH